MINVCSKPMISILLTYVFSSQCPVWLWIFNIKETWFLANTSKAAPLTMQTPGFMRVKKLCVFLIMPLMLLQVLSLVWKPTATARFLQDKWDEVGIWKETVATVLILWLVLGGIMRIYVDQTPQKILNNRKFKPAASINKFSDHRFHMWNISYSICQWRWTSKICRTGEKRVAYTRSWYSKVSNTSRLEIFLGKSLC